MFFAGQGVDPVLRSRPLGESSMGRRPPQVIVNILHRVAAAPVIPSHGWASFVGPSDTASSPP